MRTFFDAIQELWEDGAVRLNRKVIENKIDNSSIINPDNIWKRLWDHSLSSEYLMKSAKLRFDNGQGPNEEEDFAEKIIGYAIALLNVPVEMRIVDGNTCQGWHGIYNILINQHVDAWRFVKSSVIGYYCTPEFTTYIVPNHFGLLRNRISAQNNFDLYNGSVAKNYERRNLERLENFVRRNVDSATPTFEFWLKLHKVFDRNDWSGKLRAVPIFKHQNMGSVSYNLGDLNLDHLTILSYGDSWSYTAFSKPNDISRRCKICFGVFADGLVGMNGKKGKELCILFSKLAARFYGEIMLIHPCRDACGPVSRMFLLSLSLTIGIDIDSTYRNNDLIETTSSGIKNYLKTRNYLYLERIIMNRICYVEGG